MRSVFKSGQDEPPHPPVTHTGKNTMSKRHRNAMSAGLTRSASGVGEPGTMMRNELTGARHTLTKDDYKIHNYEIYWFQAWSPVYSLMNFSVCVVADCKSI